jgi:hypothetical protein
VPRPPMRSRQSTWRVRCVSKPASRALWCSSTSKRCRRVANPCRRSSRCTVLAATRSRHSRCAYAASRDAPQVASAIATASSRRSTSAASCGWRPGRARNRRGCKPSIP